MTGVVLIAFNRPGLSVVYQSLAVAMIALVVRYSAVDGSLVESAVATADRQCLTRRARSGRVPEVFRDTVWPWWHPPAPRPGTWCTCSAFGMWRVVLIQPPGGETLAPGIFNLLHYGHAAQVNSLCILLLGLALVPWLAWTLVRVGRPADRGGLTFVRYSGCSRVGRNQSPAGK